MRAESRSFSSMVPARVRTWRRPARMSAPSSASSRRSRAQRSKVDPKQIAPRDLRQRPADIGRCGVSRATHRPEIGRTEGGPGTHGQSPLRLGPAGDPPRRAGDPARAGRVRPGRRHREHEHGAASDPRRALGTATRRAEARGLPLGRAHRLIQRARHGEHRGEPRAQVRHHARPGRRVRGAQSPPRGKGARGLPLLEGDRAGRGEAEEGDGRRRQGRAHPSRYDARRTREARRAFEKDGTVTAGTAPVITTARRRWSSHPRKLPRRRG